MLPWKPVGGSRGPERPPPMILCVSVCGLYLHEYMGCTHLLKTVCTLYTSVKNLAAYSSEFVTTNIERLVGCIY